MLPRWLWFNHVPAGLDLTPEQYARMRQRLRAMRPAEQQRHMKMARRVWIRLGPALALLIIAFFGGLFWLMQARLRPGAYGLALTTGILGFQALVWITIAWATNRAIAPLVWRALNDIGFRVCIECGYILDYLPLAEPRCPECGTALCPSSTRPPVPTDSQPAP